MIKHKRCLYTLRVEIIPLLQKAAERAELKYSQWVQEAIIEKLYWDGSRKELEKIPDLAVRNIVRGSGRTPKLSVTHEGKASVGLSSIRRRPGHRKPVK